jgi:ATP-dependent helicase/nuclease subunit A
MSRPRFTEEQAAAVADRSGSALLAAAAGSGKTAVMVERFVEAVRHDGVAVGAILALTFTEKAAGELRERIRRRLVDLGEEEHARAVDAAWVGTIHGFCARVLRAQPLAAGLDPRFEVLDEPASRRVADAAYEQALELWSRDLGAPALEVAAAYGPELRDMIVGAHDTLRSRGERHPRIPVPAERGEPDAAVLRAARDAAVRELEGAGDGARVRTGLEALAACAAALDAVEAPASPRSSPASPRGVPWPGALDAGRLKGGAKALEAAPCEAYRDAWTAYRSACADHHARATLMLLDGLLDRFGRAYEDAKAARSGLDFEDLELRARDLLSDPAQRARWAERFALIMVDEFQDTNRLQLDLLEALERDNLFVVGDEFQSIYRFRHADVTIFRERAAKLAGAPSPLHSAPGGSTRVRRLSANFRSREELLDVLNGAFAAELGPGFAPLVAGRDAAPPAPEGRLFDPDPPAGAPPVELLITDTRGWEEDPTASPGLAGLAERPWRAAEARLVAHRLRAEVDAGRRPGDIVVLVRATASLRLLEQALEDQQLPTYVVGGRGYWSQEQVRDGRAWLAALANPRDEESLLAVLASPFCGAGTDALVLLAEEARRTSRGMWATLAPLGEAGAGDTAWAEPLGADERARLARFATVFAAERAHAERLPVEVLLERGISATGYDLAILARAGGDRRMANLRKLMRLARDHERAEGRDLRGFLDFAAGQDLTQAREGEAALESEGLDAVRLMTIHRAKGLEFPVVCVADLGRGAGGRRPRLLLGPASLRSSPASPHGSTGLRIKPIGGGDGVPALAWERLAAEEERADAEEERRLFYVAMTRARELLVLSGGVDAGRWPDPRPGGPPLDWIARALVDDPAGTLAAERPETIVSTTFAGRPARLRCALNAPATLDAVLPRAALAPTERPRPGAPSTALPAPPGVLPAPPRPRPAPQRVSYSSLQAYARCGYRFYLQRILGLPDEAAPPPPPGDGAVAAGLEGRVRGTIAHRLLEELDFARPAPPLPAAVVALGEEEGARLGEAEIEDLTGLVMAVAASPLRERLAGARRVHREAPFAFAAEPDGGGPLVHGYLDVLAEEAGGRVLIVDYKSDRLDGRDPQDVVELDYSTQRLVYALAGLRHGSPEVEVAYVFLERPADTVSRTFTSADAPVLGERLQQLARGVVGEEWPVTDRPHRELCADCPGRRTLCSWPEAVTLAPSAA